MSVLAVSPKLKCCEKDVGLMDSFKEWFDSFVLFLCAVFFTD
ncbi:Uncharacterised protein [Legionella taurinensis]|nr:Uncharacterised protein [Legionella taurinensis]